MFKHFDPSLFDDPDFKEDSVREEIIVPILTRLGYSASGPNKIVRSKSLLHPFVMIGSKKHPVHIIPDYLLYSDGRPGLVLDAKRPNEDLVKSVHAEQAFSYAIHPEVRVQFYALCSGKQLAAYDISGVEPVFVFEFAQFESRWELIESVLGPKNVSYAAEMHFNPDFGVAVVKLGSPSGTQWLFPLTRFSEFMCVDEGLYTVNLSIPIGEVMHLASFDSDKKTFDKLLQFTDKENRKHILKAIRPGIMVNALRPIYLSLNTVVGEPTRGQHDVFVPFIIRDASPVLEADFLVAEALFSSGD